MDQVDHLDEIALQVAKGDVDAAAPTMNHGVDRMHPTFQVTAMYRDAEVGFGEGEAYEDAARQAADSVSSIYPAEDVVLVCTHGILETRTPLDVWREFQAPLT